MNRMTLRLVALVALAVGLIGIGSATMAQGNMATPAASPMAGGMMNRHGMGGTAAVFLMIENSGADADRLIGGSTDVAEVVEIHEIVDNNGVMEMRPLTDGLEIPAGETVTLQPGGYHVMLIGLKQDLTAGSTYELTLTFEKAGDVKLQVPVQRVAPQGDEITKVEAGDLTISAVWSRPAPALDSMTATPGTPEATPSM